MTPVSRRSLFSAVTGRRRGWRAQLGQPAIRRREAWAVGRPPTGPVIAEDVKFLVIHHSGIDTLHTSEQAPEIIRDYYDLHTSAEKGWNDIAYNFLIDADGGIWEGRAGSIDGPVAGDATGGNQGFSQLICLIGNYDEAKPTVASLASLVSLSAWLAERYRISTAPGSSVKFISRGSNLWPAGVEVATSTIASHRAMSQTSCPGDRLDAYVVTDLMADVDAARTVAAPTTTSTLSASTDTTVGAKTPAPPVTSAAVPTALSLDADSVEAGTFVASGAVISAVAALVLWRHRRTR